MGQKPYLVIGGQFPSPGETFEELIAKPSSLGLFFNF